jgi:putative NIF3 family GTP cyclohydrolase 1 type 2
MGMERVRVAGDLNKIVRAAGFPWGGLGLDSNIAYAARCVDLGAEVLIAGESDEYGMTFANDSGVPLIETGHAHSENIGLENFTHRLTEQFPDVPAQFFPDTCPYVHV